VTIAMTVAGLRERWPGEAERHSARDEKKMFHRCVLLPIIA
jgi:hypothetical protein